MYRTNPTVWGRTSGFPLQTLQLQVMHQSEGFQVMIFANRPSIISEGQVAEEFHNFIVKYFPALPSVGSSKANGAFLGVCMFYIWLVSVLGAGTRMNAGEQSIMVGSSSLQRLMRINPDAVWAALQVVPETNRFCKDPLEQKASKNCSSSKHRQPARRRC